MRDAAPSPEPHQMPEPNGPTRVSAMVEVRSLVATFGAALVGQLAAFAIAFLVANLLASGACGTFLTQLAAIMPLTVVAGIAAGRVAVGRSIEMTLILGTAGMLLAGGLVGVAVAGGWNGFFEGSGASLLLLVPFFLPSVRASRRRYGPDHGRSSSLATLLVVEAVIGFGFFFLGALLGCGLG